MRKTISRERIRKAAIAIAFLVIPGSLLAVAAYAAYKKMAEKRKKQKNR